MIDYSPIETRRQFHDAMVLLAREVYEEEAPDSPEAIDKTHKEVCESELLVACVDNVVKGAIAYRIEEDGSFSTIDALATDPETRDTDLKLGRGLLEYLEEELKLQGVGRVVLDSLPGAEEFYQHMDYTKLGRSLTYSKEL